MIIRKVLLTAGIIAGILLTGCSGNKELKKSIEPIADAMCRFIDIQNQLQVAMDGNDSTRIDSLSTARIKVQEEMTTLNEQFMAKYGDKKNDEKFLKDYKKVMNKALLDCPHLSTEDREMLEKSMDN